MNLNVAAENAALAGAPRCILVVEDETLIRFVLSDELRDRGFDVLEACNADEAVELLKTMTPDLILSDVQMPGSIDGAGLLAFVKDTFPKIPVIIASGNWDPTEQQMESACRVVCKPFSLDSLVRAIQEELGTADEQ
jgi:CheY-like chemotaxis protein